MPHADPLFFLWLTLGLTVLAVPLTRALLRERVLLQSAFARESAQGKRLRETEALIESADDAIVSSGVSGPIRSWNRAAERMSGFRSEEMVGWRYLKALKPEDLAATAKYVERASRGENVTYEILRRHRDGRLFWLSESLTPVKDESGRVVAIWAITRDETERHRLDESLRAKTEELERSNKDLESYAYIASHDLQEPVRKIASFTQLLQDRYRGRLDSDADRIIGIITDSAKRMQLMIQDLLAYARITRIESTFERVSTENILDQALSELEQPLRETGAVVTHEPLPEVEGDASQLARVFRNLLSNAVKFHGDKPPRVRVSAHLADGRWEFALADNGIGFEPGDSKRLFKMFERLHPRSEYPGTGIGLAVCRSIIERHGGHIRAESKPGAGAIFYFDLPPASDGNDGENRKS
jgi:PAS domain S-box-containing protein